jgi:tRNA (guanine26-N2/guanine27-N2)-dimethyltransferase
MRVLFSPLACSASSDEVLNRGAPGRRPRFVAPAAQLAKVDEASVINERGVAVDVASAFYRRYSSVSRDLAVLAARSAAELGTCEALDVLTGAGMRAARYLVHAKARRVVANDISTQTRVADNLASVAQQHGLSAASWTVTHEDGCRLLSRLALDGHTFDVVDVDGFGSKGGIPVSLALGVVRFGGVLVLNSTDWQGLLGREHSSTMAAYGAVAHACPGAPENALRVLLGSAARDAAQRGMHLTPLASYAAPGPAFRLIVRVTRGKSASMAANQGYNLCCRECGCVGHVPWTAVDTKCCNCGTACMVSGPLWHGPLHCADTLRGWQLDAEELGWLDPSGRDELSSFLGCALEETSAPEIPPYYVTLEQLARAARLPRMPSRDSLHVAILARGFVATRTHCDHSALRTNAPWPLLLEAASMVD